MTMETSEDFGMEQILEMEKITYLIYVLKTNSRGRINGLNVDHDKDY